jgi:hypothetical protein
MDGAERPRRLGEIPLKAKYRDAKPRGKHHADYDGNTGVSRHKHTLLPMMPGIKRKKLSRSYLRRKRS